MRHTFDKGLFFYLFYVISIPYTSCTRLKYPERVENQFIFSSKTPPAGISVIYEADDRRVKDIHRLANQQNRIPLYIPI